MNEPREIPLGELHPIPRATTNPQRTAIVITTIGDGSFVSGLHRLMECAPDHLSLIVVGDRKTPSSCPRAVAKLCSEGLNATWFGIAEQQEWLLQIPRFASFLPWDSDNRRNVGVLEAWRRGDDIVVSLDDDSEPIDHARLLNAYRTVGGELRCAPILSDNKWINVCSLLECTSAYSNLPVSIYPRGFPVARRGKDQTRLGEGQIVGKVALHLGLWLGEPDVDAATRSATAPRAHALKFDIPMLAPLGKLSPISTQNVAVARRLIPAWWNVRMGEKFDDLQLRRFGDVLQGYFALMAMEAMGEQFAVGQPLVNHERNPHSMYDDLSGELFGMSLVDAMLPLLEDGLPRSSNYATAYLGIARRLLEWAHHSRAPLWGDRLIRWTEATASAMDAWVEACRTLDPTIQP